MSKPNPYKIIIDSNNLHQMLPSTHINFLLGSGANGNAFPQLKMFIKTKAVIEKYYKPSGEFDFEESINAIGSVEAEEALKAFVDEFNDFYSLLLFSEHSYINIVKLVETIYELVNNSENTMPAMSKINIFSLNYDDIVETAIKSKGYFANVVSPKNLATLKHHNVITKSIDTSQIIPSFVVTKLHGEMHRGKLSDADIVLPGNEKFNLILNEDFFQLLFIMKSELLRKNSVLFVIGYSWRDGHTNNIIRDAINKGLTVIWFKYDDSEKLPAKINESEIIVINPIVKSQDTTLTCRNLINEVLSS